MANDANCFALAEAELGAARGYETVFGVILGTGVGGGIVVNGQVINGAHGIAGEWGQIVIDPNGPPSSYGSRGTIEAFISGPGLQRFYTEKSGEQCKLEEIVARAESDPHARATIDRLTDYFARSIAVVIDVLDPHAIVIGGGVGQIDALYTEETRRKIGETICNPSFDAALLRPSLGDSAGVFGAAMLLNR
jgi:predicted NBD/HSP70 family sugar kinase